MGDPSGRCHCNIDQIERYRRKILGPLLDRIDIHVDVPRVPYAELEGPPGETSVTVRKRVMKAHGRQHRRCKTLNSHLTNRQIEEYCTLKTTDRLLLRQAMDRLQLSARAYHRILKVARTIADLDGTLAVATCHLTEAINYRRLDRQ
ncbi:MAG TPA: hypothetical protein DDW55_10115 [Gammaproteobacteria bacterium]|nr:hypothetical protein [Gammaproteobacteria bacterium]